VNNLKNLHPGAFVQFTRGRIVWSELCSLISSLMEGAEWFIFMYFHLESLGVRVFISLIVRLIWV